MTQQAEITNCPNKRMTGAELRRLRVGAKLSEAKLAERFGTNRKQIERWQTKAWFELDPVAMQQLLNILDAEVTYEPVREAEKALP